MSKERIIKNLTFQEKCRLYESEEASNIEWYPDDVLGGSSSDIVVYGTEEDVTKLLVIMGRKE